MDDSRAREEAPDGGEAGREEGRTAEAVSRPESTRQERKRLRMCRGAALSSPVLAAAITMTVLSHSYLAGWPLARHPVPLLVLIVNGVLGTAVSVVCGVLLHPRPGRRRRAGAAYLLLAPLIYALCFVLLFAIVAMNLAE